MIPSSGLHEREFEVANYRAVCLDNVFLYKKLYRDGLSRRVRSLIDRGLRAVSGSNLIMSMMAYGSIIETEKSFGDLSLICSSGGA